jgi:hypothetical protein
MRPASRTTRPRPAAALTDVAAEGDGGAGELLAPGPLAGVAGEGEEPATTSILTFMPAAQWPLMPQMK